MPIQLAKKSLSPCGIEMGGIIQRRLGVGRSLNLSIVALGVVQVHRRVAVVDFLHFGRIGID